LKQVYPSRLFLYLLGGCCAVSITPFFVPAWGTALASTVNLVLITATLWDVLYTRPLTEDHLEVSFPEELGVGREDLIRIRIDAPMEQPVRMQMYLTVSDALTLERSTWDVRLPPGEPVRVETSVRARDRTRATIGPLQVRHRGVMGLLVWNLDLEVAGAIDVIPDIREIRNNELQVHQIVDLIAGQKTHREPSQEGEFDSLVEYEPGMDPRKIDWKASARHYRMLSRKYRIEQNHNIYLAMDTGRLMGTRSGGLMKLDWAINAALRLAFLALNVGDRVGMMSFARDLRTFVKPDKGLARFKHLLNQMNQLDAVDREPNFIRAFRMLSRRENERSLVVVFTDFVDRVSASILLEALSHIRKRHVVLFVACRDVELQETLLREPDEMEDVHRQNEAFRLLKDREQVIREIQRMNITTIDRDATDVTPRLINQYLNLKSTQKMS